MIQGKILSYGDNLEDVFMIREKVFVEELGVPKENEFDELEDMAMHVLVFENNLGIQDANHNKIPVATGRIIYDGENCVIDHVAVLKEFRNKEYGDFTIRMLINRALISGIDAITITSPINVASFFEKVGFVQKEDPISIENDSCIMILDLKNINSMCKCKH